MASCIFVDKIAGLNTHSPEYGQRGCVEIYEEELGRKLYTVHRLDKATSGALVLATSSQIAADLTKLFEQHLVKKRYLFLTDKKITAKEFTYESFIEKEKNVFVSRTGTGITNNAKTTFRWLKSLGRHELWEAEPHSGKPHQIRLHAEANGMAILGDSEHNGTHHHRLCLHSLSLGFTLNGEDVLFETDMPAWATDADLADKEEDSILSEAFQRRERLYKF